MSECCQNKTPPTSSINEQPPLVDISSPRGMRAAGINAPPSSQPPTKRPTPWEFYTQMFEMAKAVPVPILVDVVRMNAHAPTKTRDSDLGWDIYCLPDDKWATESFLTDGKVREGEKYFVLYPGDSHTFQTGVKIATPESFGFLFKDRSSIGCDDIIVTAGVIEGTYRGEWRVHLVNVGKKAHKFVSGDRIAQAILTANIVAKTEEVDKLPPSDRGDKGFGSSGA